MSVVDLIDLASWVASRAGAVSNAIADGSSGDIAAASAELRAAVIKLDAALLAEYPALRTPRCFMCSDQPAPGTVCRRCGAK